MGFYGKQPIDIKKCKVTYLWTGLRTPGMFSVYVKGEADNYSYGFDLVRDPKFVGGLKIDSMGWTGPVGPGKTPYSDHGTFNGQYLDKIVLSGSNGDFLIDVEEIPHDKAEDYIREMSQQPA